MNEADRQFKRFLDGHPRPVAQMASSVRQLIIAFAPSLREDLKPGCVRYRQKDRTVCDVTMKADHVSLQFYHRQDLSNPDRRRIGTGKRLRHIELCESRDLRPSFITRLLKEAASDND